MPRVHTKGRRKVACFFTHHLFKHLFTWHRLGYAIDTTNPRLPVWQIELTALVSFCTEPKYYDLDSAHEL